MDVFDGYAVFLVTFQKCKPQEKWQNHKIKYGNIKNSSEFLWNLQT